MDTSFAHISRRAVVFLIVILILIIATTLLLIRPTETQPREPNDNQPADSFTDMQNGTSPIPQRLSPTPDDRSIDFTGYQEETYSNDEIARISQTNTLRESSPFDASFFVVSYNYKTLRFDVVLRGDSITARGKFDQWRTQNYPAIPLERFVIE